MIIEMKPVTNKKGELQKQNKLTKEILDDLSCRFIINVPEEERQNLIRICFQIELAHWFYIDFYCDEHNLKPYGINQFALRMFRHIPFLRSRESQVLDVLKEWRDYKRSVPTYGAILLNKDMTQVLLVQSYWTKTSWGFPKGKVNQDEDPLHCAVREVYEEIGFDISSIINKDDYIETVLNDQINRLYIVPGISMETKFSPQTRNEIRSIEWFALDKLPSNRKDHIAAKSQNQKHSFYMVLPFIRQLKGWVSKRKIKGKQNGKSTRQLSKNSRLSSKNSKLLSTVNSKLSSSKNLIQNSENLKSLPKSHKSMPVNPSPKSIDLIDPAIIFTPEQKKDNSITLTYQTQEFFAMFPERYSSPKTSVTTSHHSTSPSQQPALQSSSVEPNAISEAKLKEFFAMFPQCLEVSKMPGAQKDTVPTVKATENKSKIKKTSPWPEFKFNTAEILKYF
ncbi:NUDIX hydrolase domain,NUDIX hydrolase domain-like,NUDIX hydrolase, conserved site,mRNA decapping [Cinara cedri]|uniref:m7GpppN-mRNA hydrolase n=1 Tax=Cinara cedri TaxID=506608 RepID=A0A5E4M1B1_9HEMI|nr:NUDIX hydrolase domain,NUDIX hydrolase domain-like,NUDIX hydrolase, conserved site,mRNA decapping [Cinara cedri]